MTIDPVELERLSKAATQGVWEHEFRGGHTSQGEVTCGKHSVITVNGGNFAQWRDAPDDGEAEFKANGDFVCALVNAYRTGQLVPAQPSNRIIYNLQKGGDRLCDALRKIAAGCDEPGAVAKAALNHKAQWLEPPPQPSGDEVEAVRKFNLGDRVTKTKGSSWTGLVVGFYSTSLTPIGYAVESENEPGSVQIYPESALEACLAMENGDG